MEMIDLQTDSLQEEVSSNEKVIVQYGAGWCGNCRIIKPKFKRLAGEHSEVKFIYVDAEKLPNSRALAEVKNLPTFAGFKNGKLISQAAGNKVEVINTILDEIAAN